MSANASSMPITTNSTNGPHFSNATHSADSTNSATTNNPTHNAYDEENYGTPSENEKERVDVPADFKLKIDQIASRTTSDEFFKLAGNALLAAYDQRSEIYRVAHQYVCGIDLKIKIEETRISLDKKSDLEFFNAYMSAIKDFEKECYGKEEQLKPLSDLLNQKTEILLNGLYKEIEHLKEDNEIIAILDAFRIRYLDKFSLVRKNYREKFDSLEGKIIHQKIMQAFNNVRLKESKLTSEDEALLKQFLDKKEIKEYYEAIEENRQKNISIWGSLCFFKAIDINYIVAFTIRFERPDIANIIFKLSQNDKERFFPQPIELSAEKRAANLTIQPCLNLSLYPSDSFKRMIIENMEYSDTSAYGGESLLLLAFRSFSARTGTAILNSLIDQLKAEYITLTAVQKANWSWRSEVNLLHDLLLNFKFDELFARNEHILWIEVLKVLKTFFTNNPGLVEEYYLNANTDSLTASRYLVTPSTIFLLQMLHNVNSSHFEKWVEVFQYYCANFNINYQRGISHFAKSREITRLTRILNLPKIDYKMFFKPQMEFFLEELRRKAVAQFEFLLARDKKMGSYSLVDPKSIARRKKTWEGIIKKYLELSHFSDDVFVENDNDKKSGMELVACLKDSSVKVSNANASKVETARLGDRKGSEERKGQIELGALQNQTPRALFFTFQLPIFFNIKQATLSGFHLKRSTPLPSELISLVGDSLLEPCYFPSFRRGSAAEAFIMSDQNTVKSKETSKGTSKVAPKNKDISEKEKAISEVDLIQADPFEFSAKVENLGLKVER